MKQILRLLGGIVFLFAALTMPVMTCVQKVTTHREKEALVTKVETSESKGRRGRVSTHRHLRYMYEVDGVRYDGYDWNYEADSDAQPGEQIHIVYNRSKPGDSRISEGGGLNWTQTLVFLGISGYLFFGFYRGRRQVV